MKTHYSAVNEETMNKIFKLMTVQQIDPSSRCNAIEKVFKELDSVFYDILNLDNDMILIFLCFEDVLERLDNIRNISKHKLIKAFFEKLDALIERNGVEKCKGILEGLSYISDSDITNIWLKEGRENINAIRKYHLSTVVNEIMLEVFNNTFIKKDEGFLEHEHLVNLLVEIWDWIDENDRKKGMENIKHYIKNSTSENRKAIIHYIVTTFESYQNTILAPSFRQFVSNIGELYYTID